MLAELGVTAMETRVGAVTVNVAVSLTEPDFAVTVVEPMPVPVAKPPAEIVAMPDGEVVHVAVLVRFWVVLFEYVPIAVNCCVVPFAMELLDGVTAIDT